MLLDHEGKLVGNVALFTVGRGILVQLEASPEFSADIYLKWTVTPVEPNTCSQLKTSQLLEVEAESDPKTCLPCLSMMDYLASNNFFKTLTIC